MKDFIMAAMPWVFMGLSIILLITRGNKQAKAKNDAENGNKAESADSYMSEGMCIGMCMGLAMGSALGDSSATGISLGMSIGMLFGMTIGGSIKK